MENNDVQNQKPGLAKSSFNSALLISAVLIVLTLVFYLIGHTLETYVSWVSAIVLVAGLIYTLLTYRNENLGGYISYGKSVQFTVVTGLFTGIITGLFAVLLYGLIAPELVEEMKQTLEMDLYRSNPDIDYEVAQTVLRVQFWFVTPLGMLVGSIFGTAFQSLIVGLIAGIFVKKKNPEVFNP